jgi:low temperature requirement protein LtrA
MSVGSSSSHRTPQVTPVMRSESDSVKPLELFFDLVVVLALTQCTALMAAQPTWQGLAKGLLILGVVWWSWVGYAWLTSVIDPEEGVVRIAMFTAMAALLIMSLCIPTVFDDTALIFAVAFAFVRGMHIVLFVVASREDPGLRKAVRGLGMSTAIGCALIFGASAVDGPVQGALWTAALVLDAGGPYLFSAEGWKLVPGHFAERHGLMIIIALGESIVAVGIGAGGLTVDGGVVLAAVLGIVVTSALWWLYFDVVALVAERRLHNAAPGRERNEIARDSFSYLHFPMIAGIVLVALGLKKTLQHVGDPLGLVPTVALYGGVAMYLLAHVAFRLRNVGRLSIHRVVTATVLVALVPVGHDIPAAAAVGVVAGLLVGLIVYETIRFAELRSRMRHELGGAP